MISSDVSTPPDAGVNSHYLDHVVAMAATHDVAASEDILAANGMKLLAKGSRVDADVRERLLMHKLRKPLEECVQVVDGVIPGSFKPIAESLIERHPLLAALCNARERTKDVPTSLASLTLTPPVQSLLTVYSEYQGDRLNHSVGVAMIALALSRVLRPGDFEQHRMMALAGLVHDVGELYLDPALMNRRAPLQPEQWRHIASHPAIGHRVLEGMRGAGKAVAQAVLMHHERLDGSGYPRGLSGDRFPLDGQILAAAEWLMALVERGESPLTRAGVSAKLVPGEFGADLLKALSAAAASIEEAPPASPAPLEDVAPRVQRIAGTLERFRQSREWIEQLIRDAGPALRPALESGLQRMLRIQTAFSSTGLDADDPDQLLRELSSLHDPQLHAEVLAVLRELEWRLRAVERDSLLRSALLPPADNAVMTELVARLKGL